MSEWFWQSVYSLSWLSSLVKWLIPFCCYWGTTAVMSWMVYHTSLWLFDLCCFLACSKNKRQEMVSYENSEEIFIKKKNVHCTTEKEKEIEVHILHEEEG